MVSTTGAAQPVPRSPPRLRRPNFWGSHHNNNSPSRSGASTKNTVVHYVGMALMALTAMHLVSELLHNAHDHTIANRETSSALSSSTDRIRSNSLLLLRATATTTPPDANNADTMPCTPTPNRTVLDVEDLELSCAQFRIEPQPSLEAVFGYLGNEELNTAISLKKQIGEWKLPATLRVDLGSGTSADKDGVLPTDMPVVDILNQTKLAALFAEGSIVALRASHVFEHFTYPQAIVAFQNIRCLLDPTKGMARIATPDALHPGKDYHEQKLKADWPSGIFKAQYRDDVYPGHRALWSERKMAVAASLAGLNARPLEWWSSSSSSDENRWSQFCEQPYDGSSGFAIGRSAHRDKRNRDKPLSYTSLIMDVMPQTLNDWTASQA